MAKMYCEKKQKIGGIGDSSGKANSRAFVAGRLARGYSRVYRIPVIPNHTLRR